MQVEFTPELEALLVRAAEASGMEAAGLVRDVALRYVEEEARFREGVERGIAAADRGEFVEAAQVWAKVEAILQS